MSLLYIDAGGGRPQGYAPTAWHEGLKPGIERTVRLKWVSFRPETAGSGPVAIPQPLLPRSIWRSLWSPKKNHPTP